jgi:diguanylate cyclase (GGDEF)-like protein/PAS domain S-box-containing protein
MGAHDGSSGPTMRKPQRLRTQIAVAIALYAAILITGMAVLTAIFAELAMRDVGVLLLIATLEALALAALAGSILSRRVAQPMEAWAATADHIGRGAREVSFPIARGSAELDRLGITLQAMFTHLAEREKTLEAAVAERTEALQQVVDELKLVTDGVASLIARFDLSGRVLYANRAYHEFFGVGPGGAIGRRLLEIAGEDAQAAFDACVAELRAGQSVRLDRETTARGAAVHLDIHLVPHRNAAGEVDSAYVLANDISAHKMVERLLAQQALSDALTGLPNKRHFGDRLGQALAHARRRDARGALLFIDLDDFKPVNDRLGHAAGDAVLAEVATRLTACVRAGDTVARVGGDEFAVLMEDVTGPAEAEAVAARIVACLGAAFRLPEGEASISCSIGIAFFPEQGVDATALLRVADGAMYRAKQAGKGRSAQGTVEA